MPTIVIARVSRTDQRVVRGTIYRALLSCGHVRYMTKLPPPFQAVRCFTCERESDAENPSTPDLR